MTWRAALLAVLLATSSVGQDDFGRVTTLQFGAGVRARRAALADVDADGRGDLILAISASGRSYYRGLQVHKARPGAVRFASEPDAEWAVPPDAIAFAVGDVHPDPGVEIILLGPQGAYLWRPFADKKEAFATLIEVDFLWQAPHPRRLFLWEGGVRDLDGDGLVDLLLPVAGGYRAAFQRRTAGTVSFTLGGALELPSASVDEIVGLRSRNYRAKKSRREIRIELSFDGGPAQRTKGPLLEVEENLPAPQLADWDGDGDLDVLAQTGRRLLVWLQEPRGRFASAPAAAFDLPVEADLKRRLDVAYGSRVGDLNGDGRVDCVVFAGDLRSDDLRTQVLVFAQGAGRGPSEQTAENPLFGPKGIPQQLLPIGGLTGGAGLADVDGDGRLDLVIGSLQTDVIDALSQKVSDVIEAELYVYRNVTGGRKSGEIFSSRFDVRLPLRLAGDGLREARRGLAARFFGDITGDGTSELLLRPRPDQLAVLLTRARGGTITIPEKPLWELKIGEDAEVQIVDGVGAPEIVVIEEQQVLHVRFK